MPYFQILFNGPRRGWRKNGVKLFKLKSYEFKNLAMHRESKR